MDKRAYVPGTPEEVAANLLRVARLPQGRARRLQDRRGGRLNPDRLGDVQQAADALVAAGATVVHIAKIGFPAGTPHEAAIDEAMQAARGHGRPIVAEIVETAEHQAAGEFLVKVLVIAAEGR